MIINYRSKFEVIHQEFLDKYQGLLAEGRHDDADALNKEFCSGVDWLQTTKITQYPTARLEMFDGHQK